MLRGLIARWRMLYRVGCVTGLLVCSAYGVGMLVAPMGDVTEALSYVAPLWLAGLVLFVVLFGCDRVLRWCVWVPALLCVLTGWVMGIVGSEQVATDPNRRSVDVITFNMSFANQRVGEVVTYLSTEPRASIVALLEVSKSNQSQLDSLEARFPYRIEQGITDSSYGMVLYSTFPLERVDSEMSELPERSILARVKDDEFSYLILATHLFSPRSNFPERHRKESEGLATFLGNVPEPMIVLGDFNSTPWSGRLAAIERQGRLMPARGRLQWLPTWPAHRWWTIFPVDHVFVSEGVFGVRGCQLGLRSGSDHYPLRVTLGYVLK